VQAVIVLVDGMFFQERKRIAQLAASARLPAVDRARSKLRPPRNVKLLLSGAKLQYLKTLERVKGIEPSYSAWKSPDFAMFSKAVLTFLSSLGD
jgi:hypothetical protein